MVKSANDMLEKGIYSQQECSMQISARVLRELETTCSAQAVLSLEVVLDTIYDAWALEIKHQVRVKGFLKDFEMQN